MPRQTKKIDPGRAFRLFYSEGEKMTFTEAVNKYNCYARDVLGLVGELEIPSRDKSTVLEEYPLWVLRNDDYETIAIIDADTGKVL